MSTPTPAPNPTGDPARPFYTVATSMPPYAPSEILPGLFQGGTEGDHVVGRPVPSGHMGAVFGTRPEFDVVVTLYADAQPAPWGVEELRYGFPDSRLTPRAIERAVRLAEQAHARWQAGERVLIRCQAGMNRSGLVMALTLMHAGRSAGEAIGLIRERRSAGALFNNAFVHWLITQAHEFVPAAPRTEWDGDPTGSSTPSSDRAA